MQERVLRHPVHVGRRDGVDRLPDRAVRFQGGRQHPHQPRHDLGPHLLVQAVAVAEDPVDDRSRHPGPRGDVPDGHVPAVLPHQFDRRLENPLAPVRVVIVPARRAPVGRPLPGVGALRGFAGHPANVPVLDPDDELHGGSASAVRPGRRDRRSGPATRTCSTGRTSGEYSRWNVDAFERLCSNIYLEILRDTRSHVLMYGRVAHRRWGGE